MPRLTIAPQRLEDFLPRCLETFDAFLADPPYDLKIAGWDHGFPPVEHWRLIRQRLAPDAVGFVHGHPQRFFDLVPLLREAGFEVLDTFCWLSSHKKPPSPSHVKQGWEPVLLVRPAGSRGTLTPEGGRLESGRWPVNVVLDEGVVADLDAQAGHRRSGRAAVLHRRPARGHTLGAFRGHSVAGATYGDAGSVSRFYYVNRASPNERDAGLVGMVNDHPSVKPLALERYLASLLPGNSILVPYGGTGSEAIGAMLAGFEGALMVEMQLRYCAMAAQRTRHWLPEAYVEMTGGAEWTWTND